MKEKDFWNITSLVWLGVGVYALWIGRPDMTAIFYILAVYTRLN